VPARRRPAELLVPAAAARAAARVRAGTRRGPITLDPGRNRARTSDARDHTRRQIRPRLRGGSRGSRTAAASRIAWPRAHALRRGALPLLRTRSDPPRGESDPIRDGRDRPPEPPRVAPREESGRKGPDPRGGRLRSARVARDFGVPRGALSRAGAPPAESRRARARSALDRALRSSFRAVLSRRLRMGTRPRRSTPSSRSWIQLSPRARFSGVRSSAWPTSFTSLGSSEQRRGRVSIWADTRISAGGLAGSPSVPRSRPSSR
jgi:hypothetical protein